MNCARCRAPASGPLSVAENVHEMACAGCAAEWKKTREGMGPRDPKVVLAAYRCFMEFGRRAAA